jgi:hypothetical protein
LARTTPEMDLKANTRKLANAWIQCPRRGGRPQQNLQHSCRKAPVAMRETDSDDAKAPFKEWTKSIKDLPESHHGVTT